MNGVFYDTAKANTSFYHRSQSSHPMGSMNNVSLLSLMKIGIISVIVLLSMLFLVSLVPFIADAIPPKTCDCPGTSDKALFFPYGAEAGDLESFTDYLFPIDSNIVYKVFGNNQGKTPVALKTSLDTALLKLGFYDGTNVADPYAKIFMLSGATVLDPTNDPNRHIYYRKATTQDEAIINCIIPDFTTFAAYVVTWVNVNGASEEYGTFQAVVAIDADSNVYLIRNIGSDVSTSFDTDKPLKIVDRPDIINYEDQTTIASLRGKREILLISVASPTRTFPHITEQKTTTNC